MDLLQLQYFRTVARLENLTKAARQLYVTQPNLSVSLTRLENELGAALFDRRRGKITLTPTGKSFLNYVETALDTIDEGVAQLNGTEQIANRQIRVASCLTDFISDILLPLHYQNMDTAFHVTLCSNSQVFQKVQQDEADFGFVFGESDLPGLEYILMDSSERGLMCRGDHPLTRKRYITIQDLENQRFICNEARDDMAILREFSKRAGYTPNIYHTCNDAALETNLVLSGGGVSIVPITHFLKQKRHYPNADLVCLRFEEKLPEEQLGMIRRRGCILSNAALEFFSIANTFFQSENDLMASFLEQY